MWFHQIMFTSCRINFHFAAIQFFVLQELLSPTLVSSVFLYAFGSMKKNSNQCKLNTQNDVSRIRLLFSQLHSRQALFFVLGCSGSVRQICIRVHFHKFASDFHWWLQKRKPRRRESTAITSFLFTRLIRYQNFFHKSSSCFNFSMLFSNWWQVTWSARL